MHEINWVKLELDLASFDSKDWTSAIQRSRADGIIVSSLAAHGDNAANRRRLYELNAELSADIPGRGPFHTWDEYQRVRLEAESFDPAGVFIALADGMWVGMSGVSHRSGIDHGFVEMTGTIRQFRGRGVAITTKVSGIVFAREFGLSTLRTVHHPGNAAMIALNQKLGFMEASWDYPDH